MDGAFGVFFAFILFLVVFVAIPTSAYWEGKLNVMQEAFDRGYAVRCVGKTGYYWECEK